MPAAKTAAAPAARQSDKPAPTRTVRTRRAPVSADALANDLERVLKVSQPKASNPPAKRAAAAKEKLAAATRNEVKPASTRTARKPPAAKPATKATTTKSLAGVRGKAAPAPAPEPAALPWVTSGQMSPKERLQAAQEASNTALRSISEALQAGFKYSSPKGEWTCARVDEAVDSGRRGLTVLRELCSMSASGRITVQRGVVNFASRLIGLEMYTPALSLLVENKSHALKLYENAGDVAGPSSAPPPLEPEWVTLAIFPPPIAVLDDAIRTLLCNFSLAAWCCLMSLTLTPEAVLACFQINSNGNSLHPVSLAPVLPLQAVGSMSVYLYRLAKEDLFEEGSPAWLRIRHVSTFALALCVSGAADAKMSPDRVWSSVRRTVTAHLAGSESTPRDAAEYISFVVGTVETLWSARGEPRAAWFGGAWPAVLDLWTGLGRKLGDSQIIDSALAAATAGATISSTASSDAASTSSLSASTTSTPPSSVPSRQATPPPTTKVSDAPKVVTRMTAELAKALVEISTGNVDLVSFERAVSLTALGPLCNALCSLGAASSDLALPALQGVERLRRSVVKALDVPALERHAMSWLLDYTSFVDSVLAGIHAPAPVARICLAGQMDVVSHLMKRSEAMPLDRLDAIYATSQTYGCYLDQAFREQTTACLIQAVYTSGMKLSRANAYAEAVELCRRSCVWSDTFLVQNPEHGETAQTFILGHLGRRLELLGYCLQQTGAYGSALKAYCQSCLCLDKQIVDAINADAGRKPLRKVFEPLGEFNKTMLRITGLLSSKESFDSELAGILSHELAEKKWPVAVQGAVLEAFIAAIEPIQFKPRVQGALFALMELALEIYDDSYPARRLRVIAMYMSVIASTGGPQDRFDGLKTEADRLFKLNTPGNDTDLVKFKQEYYAAVQILCTLQTYHNTESSTIVAELGRTAIDASCRFILRSGPEAAQTKPAASARGKAPLGRARKVTPTTRATGRKATSGASKTGQSKAGGSGPSSVALVLDDAERFSQLLSSLASLFGLLGYIVPKIEALNLLRTLQRSLQDMGDSYIRTSALVASEYGRLGKHSRAALVFAKAIRHANDAAAPVSPAAHVELYLRHSHFLASIGQTGRAREQFSAAHALFSQIPGPTSAGSVAYRWIQYSAMSERIALAHAALAAIKMAEADVTNAIASLVVAYRQWCRSAHSLSNIAADAAVVEEPAAESPVLPESDETSQDEEKKQKKQKTPFCYEGKRLGGLQWYIAEALFDATFSLSLALSQRGSVKECEYYLKIARSMVASVRSSTLDARTSSRSAEFETRRLKFEKTVEELEHATAVLTVDGPDAVDIQRIKGELFSRQDEAPAADEMFATAVNHLVGLDQAFMSAESRMPSARKDSLAPSLSASKEPLLPVALGHLLRQRAWLLHEAGCDEEYEAVLEQLEHVPRAAGGKAEQLLLEARVCMDDAFKYFKTDLFMSSLRESTIAMTMGLSMKRDRQSTRHEATVKLERASTAFRKMLANVARTGRVEDVRQACVSLALLGAYQTSLGHASSEATAAAAGTLASIASITLHRELLPAIDSKYPNPNADDFDWPQLDAPAPATDDSMGPYWKDVRSKQAAFDYLHCDYDLSGLPKNWAVVSITVTDDRNTMLVTRHQNGHEPIVFCIPLDRQGRRDGEDDSELFTFDSGVADLRAIMAGNDASIKSIKTCHTTDDRRAWWKGRHELDERLGTLLGYMEFCWLGAFKTVLNPRLEYDPDALAAFRTRLDRIFHAALCGGGRNANTSLVARVRLEDTLLACFATLSSQCRDEELEDLVYFVLDLYQSHGIAVALAELDFDQMGIDVKAALADFESATGAARRPETDEHLLLVLDKNVQAFPWESIPILRGRAVSRIPSLPFLLDQVALGAHEGHADGGRGARRRAAAHRTVDARKARYILNPGGDLVATQRIFEGRLGELEARGWSGIMGRKPSEEEMCAALSDAELVMYYGHGGGEEYVRAFKVRALRRCAVTMLWGCSSGRLRDQGDFDCTGTPCDYVLAGAPCLVANLWDVTDKDIDRVTASVMDSLGLDSAHLGSSAAAATSVVQAVSKARTVAKLQYLTGAAPVVYGIPVYMAQTS